MDAVGALRLSPLRRGLAIDSTVDIFTFYVPHRHVYGEQWIKFMKDGVNATPLPTLSQSPMLGFHKQMDNRIKLLEEILSFRMQGVEFDNGDMYVDGHKAASDVRDEFVSVT